DIRFKLSNVRTERHDVVRVEYAANSLIDFLSRNLSVWVVLRIPHVQQEDCAIFDTTRTQSSVDRKSTRLNSSHVKISYAVFCLTRPPLRSTLFPYTTLFRSRYTLQTLERPHGTPRRRTC